jgi:hypothetical protein
MISFFSATKIFPREFSSTPKQKILDSVQSTFLDIAVVVLANGKVV